MTTNERRLISININEVNGKQTVYHPNVLDKIREILGVGRCTNIL